jgi:hypothetical protein
MWKMLIRTFGPNEIGSEKWFGIRILKVNKNGLNLSLLFSNNMPLVKQIF